MLERLSVRPAAPPSAGRQRKSRLLAFVAALALAILGVVGTPSAAAAFDEETIHSLANQSRSANGLGPLTLNASLSQVAAAWAAQLAANGTLSHNPSYSSQIPGGWSKAAENVAQGYPTGSAVHQGWMNSAGHRANILGDFTDIGIAHISGGGTTWSVQVFAKYGSSVPAPAPPAAPAPQPAAAPAQAPAPASAPAPAPETPPATSPAPEAVPAPEVTPIVPVPDDVSAFLAVADDGDAGADARAGIPQEKTGTAASADDATKLGFGASFVAAVGVALAGWLRFARAR